MSSAIADIPNEVEPEYAKAVLDYNARDYEGALRMLTSIQKKAPQSTEILELKAITYKAQNNSKDAAATYRDLIQMKTKEGKAKKEIAPYSFELGVIRYNEKNWKQAEQYLNYSVKNGFNVEVSKFYLGLTQTQTQNWFAAERNLKDVLAGEVDELYPAAHYYLAQVDFKIANTSEGFGNLYSAKRTAEKYMARDDVTADSKRMAEQVKQAADATLAPFDKSQVFGSFSLMLGYDSNVLLMPSDSASTSASGKSTPKLTLSSGIGYASSPMRTIQYVPSARFNLNKNFNGDSSTGEFADTTLSLYLTKDALAPVSYGLKTEGTFVFQNQTDATDDSKKYHLYDNSVGFSPYAKWDASRKWSLGAEGGYKIVKYNGDDEVADSLKRSGNVLSLKVSAQNRANRKYWNPTIVARTELTDTDGTEFDSTLFGFQLINTMKVGVIDFSQVLGYDRTTYGSSSTDRKDSLVTLALLASKKIGPRWALIASGDYSKNSSTDSTSYSYSRWTINAGVSYNF